MSFSFPPQWFHIIQVVHRRHQVARVVHQGLEAPGEMQMTMKTTSIFWTKSGGGMQTRSVAILLTGHPLQKKRRMVKMILHLRLLLDFDVCCLVRFIMAWVCYGG